MAESTLPPRSEVQVADTWNAESVYKDLDAFETEFAAVGALVEETQKYQGKLADGPGTLADWLAFNEELILRAFKLYFYGAMTQACNTEDQAANALVDRSSGLFGRVLAAVSFTEPELIDIGHDTLKDWIGQEPRLAVYDHYFDDLFRRQEHVRSSEVEELLGMLADPFRTIENTSEMLTSADMKFAPATSSTGENLPVAQSTIDGLKASPDRETRRTAWENYADGYLAMKNTLASNLVVAIKANVFTARARRYPSSLEASLFENNIPVAVFDNLIDTYKKNLPTWHRYWRIRRQALGVETLQPYDIWAPLTPVEQKITFDQAVDWITEGLAPLGEEYVTTLRRGVMEQRWVDRYPNQGKRQGAFSYGLKGTHPFIMMSFQGEFESMSTLAHELGHSMHSYFTWENQPVVYSTYSLFVAEVASNFNQAMVRAHLLNTNDDRDFQIGVIEEAMSNFHRYFFIMPTLARFEREVHARIERGEGVTADDLIDLCADLYSEGYGGEVYVDRDRTGITWAQFGHLYAMFYVYQYATGISGAHALANRILSGVPGAASDYVNKFLKMGSSRYPLEVLKDAGVDLTTPQPVEETFGVLASMVDRLEALTSK